MIPACPQPAIASRLAKTYRNTVKFMLQQQKYQTQRAPLTSEPEKAFTREVNTSNQLIFYAS